jgi:hypothetical protein
MRLKIVIGVIVAVALIGIAGVLFLATQIDGVVARTVVDYARATTGTPASLGSAEIVVSDGRGSFKELTIDNPDGYETPYFLRVDDIESTLELGSIRTSVPVVKEVLVSGAHLNAEQRGDSINLADVQRYMSQSAEPAPEDEGRIIIDRFRLTNGRVTVTSEYLSKPEELKLEDVIVEGVGRETGGATYSEATEALLMPIVRAARSAAERRLREAAGDRAREHIENAASDKLKKLIETN